MRDLRSAPFLEAISTSMQRLMLQKDAQIAETLDLLRQSRLLAARRLVVYALREVCVFLLTCACVA